MRPATRQPRARGPARGADRRHAAPARVAPVAGGRTAATVLLLLAIVALALAIHRRVLGAGWAPDDLILLEQARGMRPWSPGPWRLLSGPVFWHVAAAVGRPGPLHVFTWLLHGTTVVVLYAFARAHGAGRSVAAAAAAFGVHPVTVDAVLPISSVGEVSSAALTLGALAWAAGAARPRALAGPAALWTLALFAKESVALAPLGGVALKPRPLGRAAALLLAAVGAAFLLLLRAAGDAPGGVAYAYGWGPHVLRNLLAYTTVALATGRALPDPAAAAAGWTGPAGLLALVLVAALTWRRTRVPAFGLALFAFALAPVLLLKQTRHAHYLYLPLAGLALAACASIAWMIGAGLPRRLRAPGRERLTAATLAVLVVAHVAIAERSVVRRYAMRIAAIDLPVDPLVRKMAVASNALGSLDTWPDAGPAKLLIFEPPGSGGAFSARTGRAVERIGTPPNYDLLSAVLDSGRAIPAAVPAVHEARIVDTGSPRYRDWFLATNAVNGRLLLCGRGWEGHARLADAWAASRYEAQALAHLDRVLADDPDAPALWIARARLAAMPGARAGAAPAPAKPTP